MSQIKTQGENGVAKRKMLVKALVLATATQKD